MRASVRSVDSKKETKREKQKINASSQTWMGPYDVLRVQTAHTLR